MAVEFLLCVRHTHSFNPHSSFVKEELFFHLLYIWRNWSLGKELALEPSSMLLKSDVAPSPLTESPFSQFSCSVPMDCTMPGLPVHHQLPEPTQTRAHWVSDAIQPFHPLSSPSPPPLIFPSIRVFSSESILRIRWPKYWSFSFSISLSNEYSGLTFFRIDWLDLLAVQGTLKSLLQHHSSKASILQHSAFFMVQLSHPYTTTWKAVIALFCI